MSTYVQADRALKVTTPLGEDVLLLVGLSGNEGISQLFRFRLDLIAENSKQVPFDRLLGQNITATIMLPDEKQRYFSGICRRVVQGERDSVFTEYQLEIVPQFWLLTRKAQSRIFQHITVPDILKKVLEGLDVVYELQGTFHPRDYCVQYRETDFNFASRLMEEEGIYYFFKHSAGGHKMVVANTPQSHPDLAPESNIIYEDVEGGTRDENRIFDWSKTQELRSGKYTLWDHCFELPHKHLWTEKTILESVQVGTVSHKLKVGGNDKLEIYDYPGGYAQRFDGVDKGGGDQPEELGKIFEDNERTVGIRIQQEATPGMLIEGASNCRHFVAGHKFNLQRHFNADGQYVLTSVRHTARLAGEYRSGDFTQLAYKNEFACIPFALPYRPARLTPKPFVQGTQTAVVVGPPGEEIFTDKYSRVKVQFHWDRQGQYDVDSSCWIRVATLWAGKHWGVIHIPRIGQEVVVGFEEGDPDRPIILGSVYNADMMPPYTLPENKTQSGVKSRSSLGGSPANFNEFRFEDKKGSEEVYLHAEKNWTIMVENDKSQTIGHDETSSVGHDRSKTVNNNETVTIVHNRTETVGDNESHTIGQNRTHTIGKNDSLSVGDSLSVTVTRNISENAGMKIDIQAGVELNLIGPGGMIKIDASGVTIQGVLVKIN